jgi:hypothetical protein
MISNIYNFSLIDLNTCSNLRDFDCTSIFNHAFGIEGIIQLPKSPLLLYLLRYLEDINILPLAL